MARVAGSYASVTRGVSQQVPQDRRPGQHWEQVNMISDPVRGTARRPGSIMQDEKIFTDYTLAGWNAAKVDALGFKEYTFYSAGVEHSLIYRSQAKVSGSLAPLCWAYNKDGSTFLPVVRPVTDALVDALESGGVSSIVSVGRFLYIAGRTVVPAASTVNAWADTANARATSIWIRGGTYSRTFVVKCKMADATTKTFSYTTLSSSYAGVLNTSDIAASDPEYQKKVNDRVHAYNTAVTQWLGTANADIQPQNIAEKLRLAAAGVGLTGTRIDAHLVFAADQNIVEIEVSDGGDGSFIRGVAADVASPEMLTNVHLAGKIVRVLPKRNNEEDAYYLKAVPKVSGATGFVEVTWREAAGVVYTPTSVFAFATVKDGTFYIAGSASALGTLIGETVPGFVPNQAGDAVSSPLPELFGKRIDYLGLFQDRLVVGTGSVLLFSRPGDYLNWFRISVLTIDDRDPVEMFAIGAEDDTITCSTTYDRNLVLFGRRKQYAISGRTPLTPLNQSVTILSAHEDATEAFPVNSGNLVFFGKQRGNYASLHQIQLGLVQDSPEAYEVSQQLDTYLVGRPLEIRAVTSPNIVAYRTTGASNGLYVYGYLDTAAGQERLFDSWSRWEWHELLGPTVGIAAHNGDFLVFSIREGLDINLNRKVWIAADRFGTEGALSPLPYLDSQRSLEELYSGLNANSFAHHQSDPALFAAAAVAFDNTTEHYMLGQPAAISSELVEEYGVENRPFMHLGLLYEAFVTPTNPFVRDREGKAILSGRTTLGSVLASVADTGGFKATVTSNGVERQALLFTGRVLGSATAEVGKQPIVTRSVPFLVAREIRECTYSIKALTWLPLTITALEWKGQNFNNAR